MNSVRTGTSSNWWTTQSEKDFLKGVGKWNKRNWSVPRVESDLRLKCLMGYRKYILKRENWGNIDRNEVIIHLNVILDKFGVPPLPLPVSKEPEVLDATSCEPGSEIQNSL